MTWSFVLLLILAGLVKLLMTCLPTSVVEKILSKFELHPALNHETVTVTINGKSLEGEEKIQIIHNFNHALFLDKYDFPPENKGTPIIVDTAMGKNTVRLFIYSYSNHVDVVKKIKKKVVVYRLRSESLQNLHQVRQLG